MMSRASFASALAATAGLSACATPARLHNQTQLDSVAVRCGLSLGELIQDSSEKKLLLLIHQEPSVEQRICVATWARRNGLKTVFVNMRFPEG